MVLSVTRFLLLHGLVLLLVSSVQVGAESLVVANHGELRKLGVSVERLRHDTPLASVEIGCLVDTGKSQGVYVMTECVVLETAVEALDLAQVDAGAQAEITVKRRSESTKERSIFLVPGRDLPGAYLAFQFEVGAPGEGRTVRYLFPASRVPRIKR